MSFLAPRINRLANIYPLASISRPLLKAMPIDITRMVALAQRILGLSEGLDNITPGGAVMDRPQIEKLYQELRAEALRQCELYAFSHVSDPILRAPKASHPERPYSTEKLHSDIWRGEPRYSMNIIIPLWGCSYSVVQFREPNVDSFRPLDDYAKGDISGHDYEVQFCEGFVYYFDAMLLHQTSKLGVGQRVSIDFRALYEERLPGEESPWEPASKYRPCIAH